MLGVVELKVLNVVNKSVTMLIARPKTIKLAHHSILLSSLRNHEILKLREAMKITNEDRVRYMMFWLTPTRIYTKHRWRIRLTYPKSHNELLATLKSHRDLCKIDEVRVFLGQSMEAVKACPDIPIDTLFRIYSEE